MKTECSEMLTMYCCLLYFPSMHSQKADCTLCWNGEWLDGWSYLGFPINARHRRWSYIIRWITGPLRMVWWCPHTKQLSKFPECDDSTSYHSCKMEPLPTKCWTAQKDGVVVFKENCSPKDSSKCYTWKIAWCNRPSKFHLCHRWTHFSGW